MPVKKFVKDYLSFSRRERLGIIAILSLMLIIYFLPALLEKKEKFPLMEGALLARVVDTLKKAEVEVEETDGPYYNAGYEPKKHGFSNGVLFDFDPNTLPFEGWVRL